jgi:hypothetical protein
MSVAAARSAAFAVLEPVLPGRVYASWPDLPAPTAPAIYIGEAGMTVADGMWVATFRVRLVADGTARAACAQLDAMIDAVHDACAASATCTPGDVSFEPFTVDAVTDLPAYTFAVDVDVAASTWCQPDAPAAVPIPVPIP